MDNKLLTVEEIAEMLGVSKDTARNYLIKGLIKGNKNPVNGQWRAWSDDVIAFQAGETPATTAPVEKSLELDEEAKTKKELATLKAKNELAAYKAGMTPEQVVEWAGKLAVKEQELMGREKLLKERAIMVGGRELANNERERALLNREKRLHDNEEKLPQPIKRILEIVSVEDTRPIRLQMVADICYEYFATIGSIPPNSKKKFVCPRPECKSSNIIFGINDYWHCGDCLDRGRIINGRLNDDTL